MLIPSFSRANINMVLALVHECARQPFRILPWVRGVCGCLCFDGVTELLDTIKLMWTLGLHHNFR